MRVTSEWHNLLLLLLFFFSFSFQFIKKMGNFAILLFHCDVSLGLRSHKQHTQYSNKSIWLGVVRLNGKNTLFRLSRFIFLFATFNLSIFFSLFPLCVRISFIFFSLRAWYGWLTLDTKLSVFGLFICLFLTILWAFWTWNVDSFTI